MFFKKHKQLPEECTESERKCLNEFLNRLNYFTCPNCDNKIYSVEKYCKCSKCGRKMLIIPPPKEHKSSKDVTPAKTQGIKPPSKQPKVTVNEYGTREFHCEPPKGSKPKPPRRQYGSGSIDNSELDILLDDARATERENIMLDMLRKKIKGVNNMEQDSKETKYQYNFKYTLKNGRDFNKTFLVDHKIERETFDGIMKGQGNKIVFMLDSTVLLIDKESIETLLITRVEEN